MMKVQDAMATPTMSFKGDAAFQFLGVPTQVRAKAETTNGGFGLVESWEMPPGFASPYHTHHREDESFYILEGEFAFVIDGKWQRVGPGAFLFGPREVPHGFKVVGDKPARMLLQATPGGFEQFVIDLGQPMGAPIVLPDMSTMGETAARYGIDVLGPLPEEPETNYSGLLAADAPIDPKALTHRWIDAFNQRDWETERALRSDDFRATLSGAPQPLNNAEWEGFLHGFATAFPDSAIRAEDSIAEGDVAVTRWTISGTHREEFQGIPQTGRAVQFNGIEFNRTCGGKIVEHFAQFDLADLMRQLSA
jgi:steroid delta-isomerase-like uncharacterized protein